ncbi:SWIM zinc finger domain-containing protein [Nocardioidaceae bacterium]|nr:SWIM zinc finger domain-containing protein [Nocardioidaceae bacterium]
MDAWSRARALAAAPDEGVRAAAIALARPGPWSGTGASETLLWGRCQGTGGDPYQVSIDVAAPACRCSCPSRKHPCKHAVALLLLWSEGLLRAGEELPLDDPARRRARTLAERARNRAERAQNHAEGAETAREPTTQRPVKDTPAQAKRREARLELMTSGLAELELWLEDLVRGGLAEARGRPYAFWDAAAARLVDAQVPRLADEMRRLAEQLPQRSDWADLLLPAVGRWWAATQVWQRRTRLSPAQMGDLRAVLGWSYATAEVLAADAVEDDWVVLGVHHTDDGRVREQRTWMWGEQTHETVVVLDFAGGSQPMREARPVGSLVQGRVARYPGSTLRRAVFAEAPLSLGRRTALPRPGSVSDLLDRAAQARERNPFVERVPGTLAYAGLEVSHDRLHVVDEAGDALVVEGDAAAWAWIARSGGAPGPVFGELEAGRFRLLSALVETRGREELVAL